MKQVKKWVSLGVLLLSLVVLLAFARRVRQH